MAFDQDDELRSFERRAEEQVQRTLQLSAALEAAEVTVLSPGGEVTVRVNSAGGLADLQFHSKSDRLRHTPAATPSPTTTRRRADGHRDSSGRGPSACP